MRHAPSIRARLVVGAAIVLVGFMAVAGLALQRAHAEGVRSAHFSRLQGTVYVLLAAAELGADGRLVMPPAFPDPRLSLPGSGLYAGIVNTRTREQWTSPSSLGASPPLRREATTGEWQFDVASAGGKRFLTAAYGVQWSVGSSQAPLVLSVAEESTAFDREVDAFGRTLWTWLGAAAVFLLLSQTVLLEWGLAPLRRVAADIRRVEDGEQAQLEGDYPAEVAALTGNINALVEHERLRQTRYKEALSFLAHSLKTPLAVLRNSTHEPEHLAQVVDEQVGRMDAIVQHQLTRAAAGGGTLFAPPMKLAPVLHRIRDSLVKVYADKGLQLTVDCPLDLAWRIDEGDAFEVFGNLMDNASKWSRSRVEVHARMEGRDLCVLVEDDGPGFSDTESVLQLHVRGDERVPGHGVGLAVVNELVASHAGRLVLGRSATLGGGRVEVRLPAR